MTSNRIHTRSFKRVIQPLLRGWVLTASVLLFLASVISPGYAADNALPKEIRIGYQKYGTLIVLKARGTVEKRLADQGVEVKWTEFPFGPPLLEAINVGSIDFGTTGEAPPIFAQAAGADIVYVGNEPSSPSAEGLVVPKTSTVKSIGELKGKRVAVAKGANANYLLVKALEKGGLKYSDVEVVYLAPADARAAFESGRVEAWAIWDPYFAAAQHQLGARLLSDGTGIVSNHQFYLSARTFITRYPEIVKIVFEEIDKIDQWGKKNPKELAAFLSPQIGIELPVIEIAASRFGYGVTPITPAILAEQQKIADTFYGLKLIPKAIKVTDIQWPPVSPR